MRNMATPTHVVVKAHHSKELSSQVLFETLKDRYSEENQIGSANNRVLQLENIIVRLENKFLELAFTIGLALHKKKILVVTQCALAFLPPVGYISQV